MYVTADFVAVTKTTTTLHSLFTCTFKSLHCFVRNGWTLLKWHNNLTCADNDLKSTEDDINCVTCKRHDRNDNDNKWCKQCQKSECNPPTNATRKSAHRCLQPIFIYVFFFSSLVRFILAHPFICIWRCQVNTTSSKLKVILLAGVGAEWCWTEFSEFAQQFKWYFDANKF